MIHATARSTRGIWAKSALIVTTVHVSAIGALFVQIVPAIIPNNDPPVIAVEMAAPSSVPSPTKDAPTPRQIEAPEQTPEEQIAKKKLLFDPPPQQRIASLKPDVVLPPDRKEPKPLEKSNPLPPAPTTTDQAAPDLKPDRKVAALVVGGAANGKPSAADQWDARVRARIELMKRYPALAASQNQQDEVRVLLTVDRSGRLLERRVAASRGFGLLNEAALDAVQRAAPFPKPPTEIAGERIHLSVIVRFFKRARST